MRKFLIALIVLMVSQVGQAQFIHGSVKKNADPTKIDIVFQPTYNSSPGEYVSGLQFTMAIPVGVSAGVTAVAVGVNTFSNMGTLTAVPAYTEGSERIYTFLFANPAVAIQSWTNGVDFVGIVVTFSAAAAAAVGKMVDFTNIGGGTGFAYFSMATTAVDPTDYTNLFYAIPGASFTGTYPSGDQFVETFPVAGCTPGIVSGTSPLCIGGTTTYTSSSTDPGTWTSSNPAIATVNATTGLVTAISQGTTNITYTACSPAASSLKTLTVNSSVSAGTVSGTTPLCIAGTATYASSGATGGTWSSSNPSAATVNSSTGVVTGVAAGTTNITYTISGCGLTVSAIRTLTISPNVTAGTVNGTSPLCIAGTATYTNSGGTAGGTWSSTIPAVASVNASSGLVTALTAGTTNITYTVSTGCGSPVSAAKTLTVNPNVSAGTVSGASPLCIGATATYTSSGGTAGGTWTSTSTAVATVNSSTGLVTAFGQGTTNITYTIGGCGGTKSAFQPLTVSPNVSAGTVSGTSQLCIGQTATYTKSGAAGGTWTSTNTGIATVDASTGLVTAVGQGTTGITYTLTGCGGPLSASKTLTVVSSNINPGNVSGTSPLCIGGTAIYTSDGTTGGTWSSSNTARATVNSSTGLVTAVTAGTVSITYSVSACGSSLSANKTLTINPNVSGGTVSGTSPLCIGATATYTSNGTTGGSWSSSNTGVATVDAGTGVVTALSAGTTSIAYTVAGCGPVSSAAKSLTVSPDLNAGSVSGLSPLCIGLTATYTKSGAAGGTWSSSNTGVATVNATSGLVTAVSAGTTNITYTLSGCGTALSAFATLTVSPNVSAGTVNGTSPLCTGKTATYTSIGGAAGGTWTSSAPLVATVNSSGVVSAVAVGTTNITYTVSAGCGSPKSASKTLTITANPTAGVVSGATALCIGATSLYTSSGSGGGAWSSTNTGVATVSSTGLVTAVGAGTTDITYTIFDCDEIQKNATKTLTVNPNVNPGSVSGTTPLCVGETATYTSTGDAGGSWSSTNTAVATVNATTGLVTAVGAGTTNITYRISTGCGSPISAAQPLTVNPLPAVSAGTYPGQLLLGPQLTLNNGTPIGGTYSGNGILMSPTFDPALAGLGTSTITYSYTDPTTGCSKSATTTISVTLTGCETTVTVSASNPNNFCHNLTLTAVPAVPGSYTYEWTREGVLIPGGNKQTLDLTLADQDGVYTVTLIGCNAAPASYNYRKQNLSQSYTILALDEVELGEVNHVQSGAVGSIKSDGRVKIDKKSTIPAPGFVKAFKLEISSSAVVPIRYPGAPVMVIMPSMQLNNTTPTGTNLTIATNGTYNGNYKDVLVKKNIIAILTGTIFKKITLEEGSKLTFTSSVINVEEFDIKNGKGGLGNRTRLNFAGNTIVRVEKKVEVHDFCRVNEGGYNVTFYVEDEKFKVDGKGSRVVANVMAPNGDVEVHGDGTYRTYMTGQFIAKKVRSSDKNVIWNAFNCNIDNSMPPSLITGTNPALEVADHLQVSVFPNPSDTYFNISAISSSKEIMNVTMYNMVGVKIQQFKAMPGQIMRLGDQIVSGTYLIEVKQGSERVTLKVVKQ